MAKEKGTGQGTPELLMDGYQESGSDYGAFLEKTAEIAGMTHMKRAKCGDVTFLSHCPAYTAKMAGVKPQEDKEVFYVLDPDGLDAFNEEAAAPPLATVKKADLGGEALIQEMAGTTQMCMIIDGEKYLVSEGALPTLMARVQVNGESTLTRHNLVRNMHIADAALSMGDRTMTVMYREAPAAVDGDGGAVAAKKVFSVLGSAYKAIPQTVLGDVADAIIAEGMLGGAKVRGWHIDQRFTDLYIEFPQAAEEFQAAYGLPEPVVPGIYLETSDLGYCAIRFRGVFRRKCGESYIITDEVGLKHVGNMTSEKALEEAKASILDKVRVLPEKLCELIGRDAADYGKLDLSTDTGKRRNLSSVAELIKYAGRRAITEKVFAAKTRAALLDAMAAEIVPSRPYTYYDVAMEFISAPDRVDGLDKFTRAELRKACGKVPYILADKGKDKQETIALLPD